MRLTVCGMVMAAGLALAMPAWGDEPNPAIAATINDQMQAFLADDFAKAFGFAAPNIQALFGDPANFGAMVSQGYPMVHRPADVKMLELRRVAGNLWQRVLVTDQAGRGHVLDYLMVETPEGWQIGAVQLLPPADIGA